MEHNDLIAQMMVAEGGGYEYPRTGLVGEWLFDGNALDTSGNGFDGTVVGGATLSTDRHGNSNSSYLFDGSTGLISANGLTDLSGDDITLLAWMKNTVPASGSSSIIRQQGGGGFIVLGNTDDNCYISTETPISLSYATSVATLEDGNYHLFGMTRDRGEIGGWVIYVDGASAHSQNSANTALPNVGDALTIGGSPFGSYAGTIDTALVYDRPLTSTEMLDIYNGSKA